MNKKSPIIDQNFDVADKTLADVIEQQWEYNEELKKLKNKKSRSEKVAKAILFIMQDVPVVSTME